MRKHFVDDCKYVTVLQAPYLSVQETVHKFNAEILT